jgi:signal transduction histidine kinase
MIVKIRLPASTASASGLKTGEGSIKVTEKILITDDERHVLEATMRRLRNRGYDVTGVESSKEALEMIAGEPYDLLLLDIKMPDISGLELLRQARGINPEIMAIIVTGYGSVENAIEAMELGALDFVRKPVSIEELTVAIEGALTRGRLQKENARLKALLPLFELSKVMLSEVDEKNLLDIILKTATNEVNADFAQLLLRDKEGNLVRRAVRGLIPAESLGEVVEDDIAAEVITKLEPVIVSGKDTSRPAIPENGQHNSDGYCLYVPMAARGEAVGVMTIGRVAGEAVCQQSDIEFLCTLCGQGAIAIDNACLIENLQHKQAEVEGLLKKVVNTAENERLRLSLDLHDGPIQTIVASQLELKTCSLYVSRNRLDEAEAKMESTMKALGESVRDLRRIVRDLNPPSVSKEGLIAGIEEYVASVEQNDGIKCHFEVTDPEGVLDTSMERGIYYVIREALTNVRKHSGASEVRVSISAGAGKLTVSIADNGRGFDTAVISSGLKEGHIGIRSMKERTRIMNGTIDIKSRKGDGTTVTLTVPIGKAERGTEVLQAVADASTER